MKVTIDRDRCTGHGRCYALAPVVFDSDDDGFGFVLQPDDARSPELTAQALLAASNCPEAAIQVVP